MIRFLLLSVLCLASASVLAQPQCELPISAYLTDAAGLALDGSLDAELRFYLEEDAALPVECRTFEGARVESGWLSLTVDACAAPSPEDCGVLSIQELLGGRPAQLYVGIVVGPLGVELEPRTIVGSVPYAVSSLNAQTLGGDGPEAFEAAGTASDLLSTHAADAHAHHRADSAGIDIVPNSVRVGDVVVEAERVDFGAGVADELNAEIVTTLTGGGNADALHEHASSGHTGGACWTSWGSTTCPEGYTAMLDGVAAQPYLYESNGTGAAGTLCIHASAVASYVSGIGGIDGMGVATVRDGEERLTIVGDRLVCTICCP